MINVKLANLMSTNLITLNTEDTVDEVAQIFREKSIHHIPIVDEENALQGIVSKSDFLKISLGASLFNKKDNGAYEEALFRSLRIKDIMTKDVVCLGPHNLLIEAYNHFKDNKFHAIPIVDKGRLVGILTPLDLLNLIFEKDQL